MTTGAKRVLVTGGAGFIGSAVVRRFVAHRYEVINVDKLGYSGSLESLRDVADAPNYRFHRADICDAAVIGRMLAEEQPDAIVHLAAETHVDRSIDSPTDFVQSNVVGTCSLLDCALSHWRSLGDERRSAFRFVHVSTDEVYGQLPLDGAPFTEASPYAPSSPYAASKASSDHFARAWRKTYGLPVILTNCSNNYGPFQFPEKLIPLTILHAIEGKAIPVYGEGRNVRDWLHVEDHARALELVLARGEPGQSYNIGGRSERTNIDIVEAICAILDRVRPLGGAQSYRHQITFVADRPGHDLRYALDPSKAERALDWAPRETLETGLGKTVRWYLDNEWWWRPIREQRYRGERLGQSR